jgi:hypothetical protein
LKTRSSFRNCCDPFIGREGRDHPLLLGLQRELSERKTILRLLLEVFFIF